MKTATLAERQEARAERFTGYSGKRASESAQALDEVERLAAMIPPGQPILVGHHSERRARRDAQRIENGMKRAVMLFERAEYWEERARSALLHAKYKERPDVRWRRIKKIEADLRKAEKTIAQSQKYLTMWRAESLDLNMAKQMSVSFGGGVGRMREICGTVSAMAMLAGFKYPVLDQNDQEARTKNYAMVQKNV